MEKEAAERGRIDSFIERVIKRYDNPNSSIIGILQDVQAEYNYLPREVLETLGERLSVSLSSLYSAASFFRAFTLEPRGKHLINVCLGTACHIRGGKLIVEEIERRLSVKPGHTTRDREFTLETVNCLGCCALGPVVVIDGKYTGRVKVSDVKKILGTADEKKHKE